MDLLILGENGADGSGIPRVRRKLWMGLQALLMLQIRVLKQMRRTLGGK